MIVVKVLLVFAQFSLAFSAFAAAHESKKSGERFLASFYGVAMTATGVWLLA